MLRWLWEKMLKWGWDYNRNIRGQDVCVSDRPISSEPEVRISIYNARNGRILELYKPNPNPTISHLNGDYRLMVVPAGEDLSDVVTMMLLAEGMK